MRTTILYVFTFLGHIEVSIAQNHSLFFLDTIAFCYCYQVAKQYITPLPMNISVFQDHVIGHHHHKLKFVHAVVYMVHCMVKYYLSSVSSLSHDDILSLNV